MNRFEVIGIANQVYGSDTKWNGIQLQRLLRLAELFRAAEREECAKVCDELRHPNGTSAETGDWVRATEDCAAAIRARGEKTEDA